MMFSKRFVCMALTCALVVWAAGTGPVAAQSIVWEVENRFRLFREAQHFRGLLQVYRERLTDEDRRTRPAFALEEAMQALAAAKKLPDAFGRGAAARDSVARFGWTSVLIAQNADGSPRLCFINGDRGHFLCRIAETGDAYMEPRHFNLLARLDNAPALAGRVCTWTAGSISVSADCAQEARLPKLSFDAEIPLAVSIAGEPQAPVPPVSVRATNRTIVGFGDSFGSGEGNPDRPVVLVDDSPRDYGQSSPIGGFPFVRSQQYPLRAGGSFSQASAPIWLNAQCHRSLYSQHLRAALAIALERTDLAVTFLGYACTGAEVTTGILDFQEARDDVSERFFDAAPQLMKFLRDVCRDRERYRVFDVPDTAYDWRTLAECPAARRRLGPIDAVLLSIGGNDVGFARVISEEFFTDQGTGIFQGLKQRLWKSFAEPLTYADARQKLEADIPDRIKALSRAFARHVTTDPQKIIQIGYPFLGETASGACAPTDAGMDVHRILEMTKATTATDGTTFVQRLNRRLREEIDGLGAGGWRFIDASARFRGHAICQGGAPGTGSEADISGSMNFPDYKSGEAWGSFKPSAWRAYRPRNRWFVTPNDSFLTGHYLRVAQGSEIWPTQALDPLQPLLAATYGGAFHPNAQGHAALADAIVPVLRDVLGLTPP